MPKNFGGLPKKFSGREKSRVVFLSAPYDKTSTWGKGADKGPKAIIDASAQLELYDIETDSEVYKKGIYTASPVACDCPPEKLVGRVYQKTNEFLKDGKFVVVAGGEHTVSVGAIKAHKDFYGDISVLQLDAHADFRDAYHGSPFNHACVMSRVKDIMHEVRGITGSYVQAGIRSVAPEEKKYLERDKVFYAQDIRRDKKWIAKVLKKLGRKVYVTIDLDVFDPAVMPSTGTPEPGGLFWYDVCDMIRELAAKKEIIGFDVVELCPDRRNRAPDFLAAKLIYKILSYKYNNNF